MPTPLRGGSFLASAVAANAKPIPCFAGMKSSRSPTNRCGIHVPMLDHDPHSSGRAARWLLTFAGVWAVGIGFWMIATPLHVSEVIAVSERGSSLEQAINEHQVSFYSVQGMWGITILLVFALLYGVSAWLYVRDRQGAALVTGSAALVLTYLAGFSVGPAYLPAALATLAAVVIIALRFIGRRAID